MKLWHASRAQAQRSVPTTDKIDMVAFLAPIMILRHPIGPDVQLDHGSVYFNHRGGGKKASIFMIRVNFLDSIVLLDLDLSSRAAPPLYGTGAPDRDTFQPFPLGAR